MKFVHYCIFISVLVFILNCYLPLTMFEFTGQYYGHWVNNSYCPWFIELYVVWSDDRKELEEKDIYMRIQ